MYGAVNLGVFGVGLDMEGGADGLGIGGASALGISLFRALRPLLFLASLGALGALGAAGADASRGSFLRPLSPTRRLFLDRAALFCDDPAFAWGFDAPGALGPLSGPGFPNEYIEFDANGPVTLMGVNVGPNSPEAVLARGGDAMTGGACRAGF